MKKMIWTGLTVLILFLCLAIFAPLLTTYDYKTQDISLRLQPPSLKHIFGTDELGRDVFSRMLYGARVSISVGIFAVIISTIIGVLYGAVSGYFGGRIDSIMMRIVDIILTIPVLFLILMLIVYLGPSITNIIIIIGLTSWTDIARIIRAEVLKIKKSAFVDAAKLIGLPARTIIFKHIILNTFGPILVYIVFGISGAILIESGLSFLGLGVQPPYPSWGNILMSGKDYIHTAWWLILFPGIAIFLTIFSLNLLGEGLRDFFNPRIKRD